MTRLEINIDALKYNFEIIDRWMKKNDAAWSVVTKMLCGNEPILAALLNSGASHFSDSRLVNIETLRTLSPDCETWYLRPPAISQIHRVVKSCTGSLNSELPTIEALNEEAKKQGKIHRIIIMIELGELREGVLPSNLVAFYQKVLGMTHIKVMGIGTNIGCLHGHVPTIDQFMQLVLYRELLELKFKIKLPWISAGTSVSIPAIFKGSLPKEINHFRVGESLFLGTDLTTKTTLSPLREDVFTLKAEVVELKEKSLTPTGETSDINPFPTIPLDQIKPGTRGLRALVAVGHLDCEVRGLRPLDPHQTVAGASSDLTVINIQDLSSPIKVGATISFRPDYAASLSLMHCRYIEKKIVFDSGSKDFLSRIWKKIFGTKKQQTDSLSSSQT